MRSVEWHSRVHSSNSEGLFDACSPDGVPELRAFSKHHCMDLLHYCQAASGQAVINAVAEALGAKFSRFMRERPGWCGRVSLAGHSLGSAICLDLLTHGGSTFQDVAFPTLPCRGAGAGRPRPHKRVGGSARRQRQRGSTSSTRASRACHREF